MNKEIEKQSKFMSLVLRHQPEKIGLILDTEGWADVSKLVEKAGHHGVALTEQRVLEIVETSDKKRFALSVDGKRIRANQGHSIEVALNLPKASPPETLFHGTASRFVEAISKEGLKAGSRQHVHLSADRETAVSVGARYGVPVVLTVLSAQMAKDGYSFYLSENQVWLTDHVPAAYIDFTCASAT